MKNKTIAQQLKIKDFPFGIKDKNNNLIYSENSDGYWEKYEHDENNNEIYFENSDGYWYKQEFDKNNNEIYLENSKGYWSKSEFDENNKEIYYENSNDKIEDRRPKPIIELTFEQIAEKFQTSVENIKIKK
jgi:hypothetical protein